MYALIRLKANADLDHGALSTITFSGERGVIAFIFLLEHINLIVFSSQSFHFAADEVEDSYEEHVLGYGSKADYASLESRTRRDFP